MKWRPTLFVLHRDVGFFCLGLTLVYAISGAAAKGKTLQIPPETRLMFELRAPLPLG